MRFSASRLSHWSLAKVPSGTSDAMKVRNQPRAPICRFLNLVLAVYIWLARRFPLPLGGYMTEVIGRFSPDKRYLVIYDQLKPAYAKYYRRDEAFRLLEEAGLTDVKIHHRHGYSWTVFGRRPLDNEGASA